MKIVIHPAVEHERWEALCACAPGALGERGDAERGRGGHARGRRLPGQDHAGDARARPIGCDGCSRSRPAWSTTCSRSWRRIPCVLTNVRGLFGDVIADQVMGYVLCFARNLHTYIRQPGASTATSRSAASRRG